MTRALVVLCLLAGTARADRAQIAETRPCTPVPQGVTTQLVGDRLFLLRDDGMAWNGLWVITLGPRPVLAERIAFTQIKPRAFRVVDGRLFVVGALPPEPPPPNVMGPLSIVHPPRVIVLHADTFALEPHETAAGFPACEGPPDDVRTPRTDSDVTRPIKAVRAGELTVDVVRMREPRPAEHLLVLRGDAPVGELDHDPLVIDNYRAFCQTLHVSWMAHEYACSERAYADQWHTAVYELLAIRWGTLVSTSSAGVAVHDLTTLELLGGVSLSEMQAMSPTISLR